YCEVLDNLRHAHKALKEALATSKDLMLPALKNVVAGEPLKPHLFDKPLVEGLSAYDMMITPKWIDKMMTQLEQVYGRLIHIHFKSLGGILALQERIAQEFAKKCLVVERADVVEPA